MVVRWRSPSAGALNSYRLLFTALAQRHFKAQFFVELRALAIARKRRDVHKQFLATFGGLDKTKASVIVPLGQCSLKAHTATLIFCI